MFDERFLNPIAVVSGAFTSVYTAPVSGVAIIENMTLCNRGTVTNTIDIVKRSGSTDFFIYDTMVFEAKETKFIPYKTLLTNATALRFSTSSSSMTVDLSITELSS